MADFTTESSLRINVDEQSLQEARDEIETSIGGTEIAVSTDGGQRRGGGRSRQTLRLQSELADQSDAMTSVVSLNEERNELLVEIVDLLDDGGLGGGGGEGDGLVDDAKDYATGAATYQAAKSAASRTTSRVRGNGGRLGRIGRIGGPALAAAIEARDLPEQVAEGDVEGASDSIYSASGAAAGLHAGGSVGATVGTGVGGPVGGLVGGFVGGTVGAVGGSGVGSKFSDRLQSAVPEENLGNLQRTRADNSGVDLAPGEITTDGFSQNTNFQGTTPSIDPSAGRTNSPPDASNGGTNVTVEATNEIQVESLDGIQQEFERVADDIRRQVERELRQSGLGDISDIQQSNFQNLFS